MMNNTGRDKIVKGGVALGLRQLVSLPINALGLGLASIFLSPTDFGVLAILTVLINLALVVVDLGTTNALVQKQVAPSLRLLHQVQWHKLIAGVICILLYAFLSPRISAYYHLPNWIAFLFPSCGLVAWLQSQRSYQAIWLQRRVEWQILARIEIVEILTYNSVLVATAYLLRSPVAFVLSLSSRMALGAILLHFTTRRHRQAFPSIGGGFRALLGFGVPYQASTLFSMIQKSMNPIIVGSLAGVSSVGLVNWSNYIVALPMLPLQPLQAFLFSVVSERKREGKDDKDIVQIVVRMGSVLITLLSLVILLLLPLLITHVFGGKWHDAVPVVSVLLLGNSILLPSMIIPTYLTAQGHSLVWMKIVIIETILIWTLGGLGTLVFGLLGYAIGLLGASIVVLAIECSLGKKLTGLKVKFSDPVRLMIMAALSILASQFLIHRLSLNEGLKGALCATLGAAMFVGLLLITDHKRLRQDLNALAIRVNLRLHSSAHVPPDQG